MGLGSPLVTSSPMQARTPSPMIDVTGYSSSDSSDSESDTSSSESRIDSDTEDEEEDDNCSPRTLHLPYPRGHPLFYATQHLQPMPVLPSYRRNRDASTNPTRPASPIRESEPEPQPQEPEPMITTSAPEIATSAVPAPGQDRYFISDGRGSGFFYTGPHVCPSLMPPNTRWEVELFNVLDRANLLCYYNTFLNYGGDDIRQLIEADEEEFLEIMRLVGMTRKPLHVRRLQKALLSWQKDREHLLY